MKFFLSFSLHAIGILTLLQGFNFMIHKTATRKQSLLFSGAAFSSSLWSFGFSLIWIQTNPEVARICRSVGMIGTFLFFIFIVELILQWLEGAKVLKMYARLESYIGIFLWPFLCRNNSVEFRNSDMMGMSYGLIPNIYNTIYNIFCITLGINVFIILFLILRQTMRKIMRVFIRCLLGCCLIIFVGMVFDTILPVFGFDAFPGSTMTQGIGILCMSAVMRFKRKSELTVENISEFVYYCVDTPVLIYDEAGIFRICNNGAKDFFAGFWDKIESQLLWELFPAMKDHPQLPVAGIKRIGVEAECELIHRYCQIEVNKIYDGYGEVTGYIVVLNDLTEKQEFIEKLQISEKKADKANRAKSDFLAKMSHEIRTPINGILGMNAMILNKNVDKEITKYATLVNVSAENLLEMVNDILDISKTEVEKEKLEETCYSLQELLWEVMTSSQISAQSKGLELQIIITKPLPQNLYGDRKKIRQILLNVIGNAIKYTKEGSIFVEIDCFKQEDNFYLKFSIKDTGIGIQEENISKIFEAFERVDLQKNHAIEGTGLGLSIVKSFVELMKGTIAVESEYGKGSNFIVTLPQIMTDKETFEVIQNNGDYEDGNQEEKKVIQIPKQSILVVDDNEINRIVASELLAYTNAKIDTAESGRECLNKVLEKKYDFILLDHIMPEMDGIETLQNLRMLDASKNRSKDAIVIVLTANAIEGAKEEYLKEGFDDYLSKPISIKEIERVLSKHLKG